MTDNRTSERVDHPLRVRDAIDELMHKKDAIDNRTTELLRCLENDWNISASWDGLRRFWNIELTEEGVRLRDAELGRGECEIETRESWLPAERYHRCKHCGAFFTVMNASGDIPPCVCPNCGRKVVSE